MNAGESSPRRVFIAPDKFKGTLSARRAAEAMASGVRMAASAVSRTGALPDSSASVVLELTPLADGGEGSLAAWRGLFADLEVQGLQLHDACGRPRPVSVCRSEDRSVFECARLLSLSLPGNRRLPIQARTSHGLGEYVAAERARGLRRLLIFVGGTAVCDGGFGALRALGHRFVDRSGQSVEQLVDLERAASLRPALQPATLESVELLTDVENPLLGPSGAALLFSPQKGADERTAHLLEHAIERLVELMRDGGLPLPDPLPAGVGAGGGIALALWAAGAATVRIASGAQRFLEASGLAARLSPGDVVLTGEGRTDRGTLEGKLVETVRQTARAAGATCVIISGSVEDAALLHSRGYANLHAASTGGAVPTARAAAEQLTRATRNAFLAYLRGEI